jgi:acyl-CoA synthetase (AMP-forming)/AMP-acid ligase II
MVLIAADKNQGQTTEWPKKAGTTLDPSNLDRHCLQHIARFKRPKSYVVETELPKNNYGKVLKTELRARLAAAKTDLEEA